MDNARVLLPARRAQRRGVHALAYRSLDRAHNQEATQSTAIRIDRTPPQAGEPVIDGNQLANGWYNTPVTVTLQGDDALAGLAGFEMAQTGGDWTASTATTVITTTTQQTLTWRAVDNAGNVSAAQALALLVDLTPPTTPPTIAPLPAAFVMRSTSRVLATRSFELTDEGLVARSHPARPTALSTAHLHRPRSWRNWKPSCASCNKNIWCRPRRSSILRSSSLRCWR